MSLHPLHADRWKALANETAEWQFADDQLVRYRFFTVDAGLLWLKSGRLVPCDPLTTLRWKDNVEIAVPPGQYPVVVTLADVSEAQDGSNCREAYLSVVLSDKPAAGWRFLAPVAPGEEAPELGPHEYVGMPVDASTVGFVDADAIARLMPDPDKVDWEYELIDSGEEEAWISHMADPEHLHVDIANILLPHATDGENIVLCHSGWGDGSYAMVGTYAADGTLTGVHIDLTILPLAPLPEWD